VANGDKVGQHYTRLLILNLTFSFPFFRFRNPDFLNLEGTDSASTDSESGRDSVDASTTTVTRFADDVTLVCDVTPDFCSVIAIIVFVFVYF
jgi:hypothetical protein